MTNPLYDAIFAPLAGRADVVMILPDGQITGAEFHQMMAGIAAGLRDRGVVKGDRVAAQVAKSPRALALYGACVALGAVFLPLNTGYTAAELGFSSPMPRRGCLWMMRFWRGWTVWDSPLSIATRAIWRRFCIRRAPRGDPRGRC